MPGLSSMKQMADNSKFLLVLCHYWLSDKNGIQTEKSLCNISPRIHFQPSGTSKHRFSWKWPMKRT